MGKSFACHYANIVLAFWEHQLFHNTTKHPTFYCRYLDDIFMIWTHTNTDLQHFLKKANNIHPKIKLSITTNHNNIDFLDLTIYKHTNFHTTGKLDTKPYVKPTNPQNYLHYTSHHPPHTFTGIIKGQLNRLLRLSSTLKTFKQSAYNLCKKLAQRGYPLKTIHALYLNFIKKYRPRSEAQPLHSNPKTKHTHKKAILPLLLPYSKHNTILAKHIKKKYHQLTKQNKQLNTFNYITVYTKNKNLKQTFTKAKWPSKN